MSEWWEGLSSVLKVLYCVAVPSTILLLIQTLLSVFGMHDGGTGVDFSDTSGIDFDGGGMSGGFNVHSDLPDTSAFHDAGMHHSIDGGDPSDFTSMRLFTLQTIVAFMTVFSWTGIVCIQSGTPTWLGMSIGIALGLVVMFSVAKLIQLSTKLAESGTLDMRNCLGEHATVYVPVPAQGSGTGKVNLTVQGQFRELTAVTDSEELLPTGLNVRITDLRGDSVVVEKE